MEKNDKYSAQKKYLKNKKQLRVWMEEEKYDCFKETAQNNGQSIYELVHKWVDEYLEKQGK